jgi:hypothetical protein
MMSTSPRLAAPALLAAIAAAAVGISLASAAPASAIKSPKPCASLGGCGGGGERRDFREGSLLDRIQDHFHPDDLANFSAQS